METFEQLKKMSDDALKAKFDEISQSTVVGTAFYLEELRSRSNDRVTRSVEKLTKWLLWLTVTITVATIVQLGVVLLEVWTIMSS